MEYEINPQKLGGMIALPGCVCDYLSEASGDAVKVLLLVFSLPHKPEPAELATRLDIGEPQVSDALRYWISKEILRKPPEKQPERPAVRKPDASCISTSELVEAKERDPNAAALFQQAELLYTRPLKPAERRNLLYAFETTGLPVDVILMILDYCIRVGKATPRYILAVCEDWADREITTHEQAEEQLCLLSEKNQREQLVCGCFGIHNRKLTAKEHKYIDQWMVEYGFPLNMLQLAYEKAADAIGKLSFPYIGKILTNWYKAGAKTPEQVEQLDKKAVKPGSQPSAEASYDLDQLAQRGLFVPERGK